METDTEILRYGEPVLQRAVFPAAVVTPGDFLWNTFRPDFLDADRYRMEFVRTAEDSFPYPD